MLVNSFTDSDYNAPQNNVQFSSTSTRRLIPISIRKDRVREEEESFVVIASLPEDRGSCNTTVTIMDASKLVICDLNDINFNIIMVSVWLIKLKKLKL